MNVFVQMLTSVSRMLTRSFPLLTISLSCVGKKEAGASTFRAATPVSVTKVTSGRGSQRNASVSIIYFLLHYTVLNSYLIKMWAIFKPLLITVFHYEGMKEIYESRLPPL